MDYSGLHHFSMIKYGALSIAVWHISILSSRLCSVSRVSSISPKCVPAVARHLGAISMRKDGKHSKHMERYGKQYGNMMIIWWSFHHEKLGYLIMLMSKMLKTNLICYRLCRRPMLSVAGVTAQKHCYMVAGLFASHYAGIWWNIVTGWWFQPLWKILVIWDDYSQYMEK